MPDHTDSHPALPTAVPYASRAPVPGVFRKFLVLAVDLATYDGHQIGGYQWVKTSAETEEDALEYASFALDDGILPLAALTADDLRHLADELAAQLLEPRQAYNEDFEPTDEETVEQQED